MMQERRNLSVGIGMEADLIKRSCLLAREASYTPDQSYFLVNDTFFPYAIFAFRGSGSVSDWYYGQPYGNRSIDLNLFPSLKSIGNNEAAGVNIKFFQQFQDLITCSPFVHQVYQALSENKKIIFTGFSFGGPIAVLATIWFLQQNNNHAKCVTFGSPLVGNQIFGHAIRRENWEQHFVHFVMKYDIIPRILLSPPSSIKGNLQTVLPCLDSIQLNSIAKSQEASSSFDDVMRNASSIASHTAYSFMGCTNSLLQTITSFIELSPYRPFGTYVFCIGKGRMFTLKNTDAILLLFFYSLQLDNQERITINVAYKSFVDHLEYETEISDNLGKEDVVDLEHLLLQLPLSSAGASSNDEMIGSIETVIKELGLGTRAVLCLAAAREWENQKQRNQDKIDGNRNKIEKELERVEEYKVKCGRYKVCYYDAFKKQTEVEDFQINVTRLELAGIWDEIIEMLKRYELPDSFEGRKDWVELGTKFRRLMEPLDIANYYRHSKDEDTGAYMRPDETRQPRPKRYRYTQRWLEYYVMDSVCVDKPVREWLSHEDLIHTRKPEGNFSESCFWAEVEDLRINTINQNSRVPMLLENVLRWVKTGLLGRDVFFEKSTFVEWWETLPSDLRNVPEIAALVEGKD